MLNYVYEEVKNEPTSVRKGNVVSALHYILDNNSCVSYKYNFYIANKSTLSGLGETSTSDIRSCVIDLPSNDHRVLSPPVRLMLLK